MRTVPQAIKEIADSLCVVPAEQMRSKLYMLVDIINEMPSYQMEEILAAAFHIKEGDAE